MTQTFIRPPYIEFYILTDSGGACNESKEGPFDTVKPSRRRAKHQSSRYVRASWLLASSKETYSLYYLLPHLSCLVASARTTGDPLGCRTGTPRRDARRETRERESEAISGLCARIFRNFPDARGAGAHYGPNVAPPVLTD